MKKMKLMALMAGLLLYQGIAHAEMLTGTITSVDMSGQKVTLQRADIDKSLIIHVKDASLLSSLKTGSQVTLDANRKIFGGWEARTINAAANTANSTAAANEASKTDLINSRQAVNNASALPASGGSSDVANVAVHANGSGNAYSTQNAATASELNAQTAAKVQDSSNANASASANTVNNS